MKALLIDTSSEYLYVIVYDTFKKTELINKSMVTHNNHSENIIKLYLLRMNALECHFKYSLLCRVVFKV